MTATLSELAERLGATLEGDGAIEITAVAGVRDAGPGEIAFVSQSRYAVDAAASKASALIVARDWNKPVSAALLRVDKPEEAFAQIARLFVPPPPIYKPGIHPSAVVDPTARIGREVHIGPHVTVEAGASIGDRSCLLAGVYVGQDVQVGEDCRFYPNVSLREHVRVGHRTVIHNGTVVGSDGFGYQMDQQGIHRKIPQIGIVVVGDDVEIGANVTIDRARFGKTKIGHGVKIDNLVQIAHNVMIGDHALIVAQVGISGSTIIGHHAVLAGQVGVVGHIQIGAGAIIAAQAGILKNVPPGAKMWGTPARSLPEQMEAEANISRLPLLKKRVAELEARLAKLEKTVG